MAAGAAERGGGSGIDRLAGASSQPSSAVAATAPTIWAAMKPGACAGWMPENVSVKARATVTAGLANEVEAVNQ